MSLWDPTAAAWDLSDGFPGGSQGRLLGLTAYEPATAQNKSTTSTTAGGVDVDATNLAVTFIVPASGRVLVTLSARASMGTDNNNFYWTLRESSTQVGKTTFVTDAARNFRCTAKFVVTGLTPGDVKTWKWGFLVSGSTGTISIDASGSTSGGAYMEVWDAAVGPGVIAPVIDDDTFATATSANVPSAESTKAYVDANAPTVAFAIGDGSGNHTTTSTSLADVAAAYSKTIAAVVGDVLEIEFIGTFSNDGTGDYVALAANVSGTGDKTVRTLFSEPVAGNSMSFSYRVFHTVVSGDISGGLVTVKPRWLVGSGTGTCYNETTLNRKPVFSVKNWKQ